MYIEDPAELSMFPEYIQKYLAGGFISEEFPQPVIEFKNISKNENPHVGTRVCMHNVPRGLLDIVFDHPFDHKNGKFDIDIVTSRYYGLDNISNFSVECNKGIESDDTDIFIPKIYIPLDLMKYPVDDNINIQSGPSDMFKYIHNNTFDMLLTARKSYASSFASYNLTEDANDPNDVAGVKNKIDLILKAYKPDYKEEEFNWKSPYLFPMVESIFNKLSDDLKEKCKEAMITLDAIHTDYYNIGYDEILSKTRTELENVYDLTFDMYPNEYKSLLIRIDQLNGIKSLCDTSETLLFIKWALDQYEESKK